MNDHRQPDLALARRFVEAHPPPGRVLLCTITGSHNYGFPSPDSDLDIKGIHLATSVSPPLRVDPASCPRYPSVPCQPGHARQLG